MARAHPVVAPILKIRSRADLDRLGGLTMAVAEAVAAGRMPVAEAERLLPLCRQAAEAIVTAKLTMVEVVQRSPPCCRLLHRAAAGMAGPGRQEANRSAREWRQ